MEAEGPDPGGSRRARFEALALPLMQPLYGYALRLTRDPPGAQDLVQDTFLRAYRAFDGFKGGTNCRAWLFTIMYRVFVNAYKKQQRAPISLAPDRAEEALDRAESLTPERPPDDLPTRGELETALARLPDHFRTAVELVYLCDLSYEEAATAVGCKVGTLKSRLFRARRLLADHLASPARSRGHSGRPAIIRAPR